MLSSWWLYLAIGLGLIGLTALVYLLFIRRISPAAKSLEFATSHWAQVGAFKVHYIQEGAGPDLLLLHGIGSSIYCWRQIFAQLTPHYRVTAIDLPGFGQSTKVPHLSYGLDDQAQRIEAFLEQLEIKKTRICGCSMGGTLALWLAKRQPQCFTDVIAIAPSLSSKLVPVDISRFAWTAALVRWSINETLIKIILKRVVSRMSNQTPEDVRQVLSPYLNNSAAIKVFAKAIKLVKDPRLPTKLIDIKNPVMILWGEKDQIIPVKSIRLAETYLPHALCYIHPEGSHHLMEDEPEWVFGMLKKFFTP